MSRDRMERALRREGVERALRDGAGLDRDGVRQLERRLLLRRGLTLSSAWLLAGCDVTNQAPVDGTLRVVSRFNDWVQAVLFQPGKLAPTYAESEAVRDFRFNAQFPKDQVPIIDPAAWTLEVGGLVQQKRPWTLSELHALPQISYVARHVCVEGWTMIGQWGGVSLRGFLERVGADTRAKYVAFRCDDPIGYTGSIDMASALHPQTMLCLTQSGAPLTPPFGAPMRLRMTTKLGFKQPKWISSLWVTNDYPGGYWEDLGYNWFSGI